MYEIRFFFFCIRRWKSELAVISKLGACQGYVRWKELDAEVMRGIEVSSSLPASRLV